MIRNVQTKSPYDKKRLSRLKENYFDALGQSIKEQPLDAKQSILKQLRAAEDALIAFAIEILPEGAKERDFLAQSSNKVRTRVLPLILRLSSG